MTTTLDHTTVGDPRIQLHPSAQAGDVFTPLRVRGAVVLHLTRGKHALVDPHDYRRVRVFQWHAVGPMANGALYAANEDREYLHRLIMRAGRGTLVDHRDNNGLDCRRQNLRLSDKGQNTANRHTRPRASGLKGVHWNKNAKKFCAQIRHRGKRIYLGLFTDEVEAAKAYDAKARELWGEFANTNFPAMGGNL